MTKDKVLVANGQGFWGDSILGPVRLVEEGPLDYLTLDYLAEVTMSIMQKLRSRKPDTGYATDFVRLVDRILPTLVEKDVRVVANAGGVNPMACKDALLKVVSKHGLRDFKVAVVEGDDVLDDLDDLIASGEELANMETGEPLSSIRDRVSSANVYLGAFPIAEALDSGARIVITNESGRLMAEITRQSKVEVFPENDTTFFDKTDSPLARTVFERDASGKVVAQTYRASGQKLRARKIR